MRSRAQVYLQSILQFAILITFLLIPWWVRPDGLPTAPYVFGFLLIVPVIIAIVAWVLLDCPGLRAAFHDSRRWWILFASMLLVWAFLSVLWADYKTDATNAAFQLACVILFMVVATCAGPSARQVVVVLAIGLICQGVIAIGQVWVQRPIIFPGQAADLFNQSDLSTLRAGNEIWVRPVGTTVHPNILGGFFAVALLGMAGWLIDRRLARWRYAVRLAVAALGLWGLCLTFSRSAWGGFVVGLIVVNLWWQRLGTVRIPRQRLLLVMVVGAILIGSFGLTYTNLVAARTGTGDETYEQRSISDREVYLNITAQVVVQHPILGIGIGNFPLVATDIINQGPYRGWMTGDNVHNIHLLALAELGIVGFVLWLLVWGAGFAAAIRMVRDPFAVALIGGSVALLATGMLDHYPWSIFHLALLMWASLGIALSTCNKAEYS